jgi:hypothetical protein
MPEARLDSPEEQAPTGSPLLRVARVRVRPPRLSALRLAAPCVYLALAGVVVAKHGVPLSRDWVFVWILGGLLCLSVGSLSRFVRSLLTEWLPLMAALTLYDVLRGVGAGRFPIHSEVQIWIDRYIFGFGSVPSVWLQQHLWSDARITWYDKTLWLIYTSYYLVTPLLLGWLWLRDAAAFRRYAIRLTALAFGAVAFFTVSPTVPPWLASQKGMIGPITRIIGPIGRTFGGVDVSTLWERGVRFTNDLAAFPSLHEAMTILVVVTLWSRSLRPLRVVLVLYPLAMAFALVYTGEHYVTDLAGGVLLLAAMLAAERWAVARPARRRAQTTAVASVSSPS